MNQPLVAPVGTLVIHANALEARHEMSFETSLEEPEFVINRFYIHIVRVGTRTSMYCKSLRYTVKRRKREAPVLNANLHYAKYVILECVISDQAGTHLASSHFPRSSIGIQNCNR